MYLGIPRFDDKIAPDPNTGCWLWTGAVAGNGYPSIKWNGSAVGAHCFAYRMWRKQEMAEGRAHPPLLRGMVLMHKCDTPLCCNPHHSKPGTHAENMQDMVRKGRAKGQWPTRAQMDALEEDIRLDVPRETRCASCGQIFEHTFPLCQCGGRWVAP